MREGVREGGMEYRREGGREYRRKGGREGGSAPFLHTGGKAALLYGAARLVFQWQFPYFPPVYVTKHPPLNDHELVWKEPVMPIFPQAALQSANVEMEAFGGVCASHVLL